MSSGSNESNSYLDNSLEIIHSNASLKKNLATNVTLKDEQVSRVLTSAL
jgi:hypothetical protein